MLAQKRPQPGGKLLEGKGLDQIIIGAAVQSVDPVFYRVPGRQKQHAAAVAPGAEGAQQAQSVHAGQHDVQHQPVVIRIDGIVHALDAVAAFVCRIALPAQPLGRDRPQRFVVLHQQKPHDASSFLKKPMLFSFFFIVPCPHKNSIRKSAARQKRVPYTGLIDYPRSRKERTNQNRSVDMRKSLLTLALSLLLLLCLTVSAAQAEWEPKCIPEPYAASYEDDIRSIAINRYEKNNCVYFVCDVQLENVSAFQAPYTTGEALPLSELVQGTGAVLAINADDFGSHKYGTIIRGGQVLRTHDTTRHMLIVDVDGSLQVRSDRKGENPDQLAPQLLSEKVRHTFEFGPVLVENGQISAFLSAFDVISTRSTRWESRTAIGMISPLHYVLIVADGRQPGYSDGMTLPELQSLMVQYGAQVALNLDGGGSTELWFSGQILNSPCDGHERRLSDIICF